jgi:AraC family transcriptional regulator of adaptative response/methylated-DNA-[protein]-cysteine methyltransferase
MKRRSSTEDFLRIEKAILFLEKNFHRQPDLKEIAGTVNLSEYHFQRLFKRWAGISPKRFLQVLTIEHAKTVMKNSGSLLEVTYETGLSSAGRLHDLFVQAEAMTPDEFRKQGERLQIRYGFHPSPFGECLVAVTDRGICHLAFVQMSGRKEAVSNLKQHWENAEVLEDPSATRAYGERIFGSAKTGQALTLYLPGTNFQIKVWQALLKIPAGKTVSYEVIARQIGRPSAVRAVANAVAHNPVAFLIPCHRVIRKTGAVGGYRWGSARKKAMLAWEAGREGGW